MIRLALIISLVIAMLFRHFYVYKAGMKVQAGIESQAREELADIEKEKVKIVYKEKIKIEVKYRDKVKTIYQAIDPTGCLDRTLGDVGLLPSTTAD